MAFTLAASFEFFKEKCPQTSRIPNPIRAYLPKGTSPQVLFQATKVAAEPMIAKAMIRPMFQMNLITPEGLCFPKIFLLLIKRKKLR